MSPAQIHRRRQMLARLRATPEFQAMIARTTFVVAEAVTLILNMNIRTEDFRHGAAFQWREANATARWRRCIIERRGKALFDRVAFEFESQSDAEAFDVWRTARGW